MQCNDQSTMHVLSQVEGREGYNLNLDIGSEFCYEHFGMILGFKNLVNKTNFVKYGH